MMVFLKSQINSYLADQIKIINSMISKLSLLSALLVLLLSGSISAQVCDNTIAPTGLSSSFTPSGDLLLEWDVVPGSEGVSFLVTDPCGNNFTRRFSGFEQSQKLVPMLKLENGTYTWAVQASCSASPPYNVTPVSAPATSTFGSGGCVTCPPTVTDVDGNVYTTLSLGGECWMGENLKTETYADGTPIPGNLTNPQWTANVTGASAYPHGNPANKDDYGLLYNGHATQNASGLCPTGWHLPSDAEWTELFDEAGGTSVAGTVLANSPLDIPAWTGSNALGFGAVPAGLRHLFGSYLGHGDEAIFWSSDVPSSLQKAWIFSPVPNPGVPATQNISYNRFTGLSVRCVKD